VNLGPSQSERIVVCEGDTALGLSHEFCVKHDLDEDMLDRLRELLQMQMDGLLEKIDETDADIFSRFSDSAYGGRGGAGVLSDGTQGVDGISHHAHTLSGVPMGAISDH